MTEPNFGGTRASVFWGTAQRAAAEHMTTAQYWDALREHSESLGLDAPEISAVQASQLRGQAGAWQRSRESLQASALGTAITGDMIHTAPYSRDLAARNTFGSWQVQFAHSFNGPEGESSEYRTVLFSGQLPYTVQELYDLVEQDAMLMANDYDVEHVGISDLSITTV